MKKTLLIIAAVLGTSFAIGQKPVTSSSETLHMKRTAVQSSSNVSTPVINNSVEKKAFTKNGDYIRQWRMTRDFFIDSIQIGTFTGNSTDPNNPTHNITDNNGTFYWVKDTNLSSFSAAITKKANDTDTTPITKSKINTYEKSSSDGGTGLFSFIPGPVDDGILVHSGYEYETSTATNQWNTWVQFPAFSTEGITEPIIIEIDQALRKWYAELSTIEYSFDGGNTWKNVKINYASDNFPFLGYRYGQLRHRLPQEICDKPSVTLRLRQIQLQSYVWFITNINIVKAKEYDYEIVRHSYMNHGYGMIPKGILPESPVYALNYENTGSKEIANIQSYLFLQKEGQSSYVDTSISTPMSIPPFVDSISLINKTYKFDNIPHGEKFLEYRVNETGNYNVIHKFYVQNGVDSISREQSDVSSNPTQVKVNWSEWTHPNSGETLHRGIWARDNGVTTPGLGFLGGAISNGSGGYQNIPFYGNFNKPNYSVMVEYTTNRDNVGTTDSMFIIGIQMVLDPAYTVEGAIIEPVVWAGKPTPDTSAITYSLLGTGQAYRIQEADIPKFTDGQAYMEGDAEYKVFEMYLDSANIILLDTNTIYLGGYNLLSDESNFAVAGNVASYTRNSVRHNSFGSGSEGVKMKVQDFPNSITGWNYQTNTPLIRLIVSDTAVTVVSIKNAHKVNDFKLDAYPNPAKDYINIYYSLDKAAKTKIEIRDVMGRLVKVVDSYAIAGEYKNEKVNISDLKSGTYIYTLNVNGLTQTKKFIVTK